MSFYPEGGNSMFRRNIGAYLPNYTASHPSCHFPVCWSTLQTNCKYPLSPLTANLISFVLPVFYGWAVYNLRKFRSGPLWYWDVYSIVVLIYSLEKLQYWQI